MDSGDQSSQLNGGQVTPPMNPIQPQQPATPVVAPTQIPAQPLTDTVFTTPVVAPPVDEQAINPPSSTTPPQSRPPINTEQVYGSWHKQDDSVETQQAVQLPPTDPAQQTRPPLQIDQIYATPNAESEPEVQFKTGSGKLPDSVYIIAGAMFIPLFIILQLTYVYTFSGVSSVINVSVSLPSGFDKFLVVLMWITFLALGAGAVMLIVYRRRITWIIAMVALVMTSACLIKPIFDSVGAYFKYRGAKSSSPYASMMTEYTGMAERGMQINILNEVLIFSLPIIASVYLNKPRVKDAYR